MPLDSVGTHPSPGLMKPAERADVAPQWRDALAQAFAAVRASCRPSSEPYRDVHLGDWFERTILIRVSALPGTLKFGYSTKFSPSTKRIIRYKSISDYRFPLPRYWPEAWRSTIEKTIERSE